MDLSDEIAEKGDIVARYRICRCVNFACNVLHYVSKVVNSCIQNEAPQQMHDVWVRGGALLKNAHNSHIVNAEEYMLTPPMRPPYCCCYYNWDEFFNCDVGRLPDLRPLNLRPAMCWTECTTSE